MNENIEIHGKVSIIRGPKVVAQQIFGFCFVNEEIRGLEETLKDDDFYFETLKMGVPFLVASRGRSFEKRWND